MEIEGKWVKKVQKIFNASYLDNPDLLHPYDNVNPPPSKIKTPQGIFFSIVFHVTNPSEDFEFLILVKCQKDQVFGRINIKITIAIAGTTEPTETVSPSLLVPLRTLLHPGANLGLFVNHKRINKIKDTA